MREDEVAASTGVVWVIMAGLTNARLAFDLGLG